MSASCRARTMPLNSCDLAGRGRRGVRVVRARRSRSCCSPSSCVRPFSARSWSVTNWCTGISSTAVTPSDLRCVDDRRVGDARVRAAQALGDVRVRLGQALDVRLVDHGLVVGRAGQPVVGPVEERVDHQRVRHVRRPSRRRCAGRGRPGRTRTAPGPSRARRSIALAYGSISSLLGLQRWPCSGSYGPCTRKP